MATIQFTKTYDVDNIYAFSETRLPQIVSRISAVRQSPQGGQIRRVEVTLQGYFTGESQDALKAKYVALAAYLSDNQLKLYYHDGVNPVIDRQVFVESLSDPVFRKQFVLDFTITLYYFAPASHASDTITASYISDAGTYSFAITPQWEFVVDLNRQDPLSPLLLPSGTEQGSIISIQLTGAVYADTPADLNNERAAMISAFLKDGTLNYGYFSSPVKVGQIRTPVHTPHCYFEYAIPMTYFAPGLVDFRTSRRVSRLHNNAIVRENKGCATTPYVFQRYRKGQFIDYQIYAKGSSLSDVRTRLQTELAFLVYPNGYEVEGGTEIWTDYPPSVDCQFTKYYPVPPITNLGEI